MEVDNASEYFVSQYRITDHELYLWIFPCIQGHCYLEYPEDAYKSLMMVFSKEKISFVILDSIDFERHIKAGSYFERIITEVTDEIISNYQKYKHNTDFTEAECKDIFTKYMIKYHVHFETKLMRTIILMTLICFGREDLKHCVDKS